MTTHEALKIVLRLAKRLGAGREEREAIKLTEAFMEDDIWAFGNLSDYRRNSGTLQEVDRLISDRDKW